MRFNIISNLNNGAGLQQDYELLSAELRSRGHGVCGLQFNKLKAVPPADVNLFLETVVPAVFSAAPQQWVVPNPEWWLEPYHVCLPRITKFLCKTHDSLRHFREIAGNRAEYLGFSARDLYCPDIERQHAWLHIAGNSNVKNTDAILMAWETLPYDLTLVTRLPRLQALAAKLRRVTVYSHVKDSELLLLFNQHAFYLCPSQYEGFGHTLHEAMGVGALVITRDGPPMNEFGLPKDFLIPSRVDRQLRLAQMRTVTPEAVAAKVHYVATLPSDTVQHLSLKMRGLYQIHRAAFRQRLSEVLEC